MRRASIEPHDRPISPGCRIAAYRKWLDLRSRHRFRCHKRTKNREKQKICVGGWRCHRMGGKFNPCHAYYFLNSLERCANRALRCSVIAWTGRALLTDAAAALMSYSNRSQTFFDRHLNSRCAPSSVVKSGTWGPRHVDFVLGEGTLVAFFLIVLQDQSEAQRAIDKLVDVVGRI